MSPLLFNAETLSRHAFSYHIDRFMHYALYGRLAKKHL